MDVNATKGGAVADQIATVANAKKAAQSSEGAASFFASVVSAATAGAAQSSGAGAMGGLFSKNQDNGDVGQEDLADSGPRTDRDWGPEEAPAPRHTDDAPAQHHNEAHDYPDAHAEAPLAVVNDAPDAPAEAAPTEQPARRSEAAPADDANHNDTADANAKSDGDAAPTQSKSQTAEQTVVTNADGVVSNAQALGADPQAQVVASVVQQGPVKTETAQAGKTPEAVVKNAAGAAGQAQQQQSGADATGAQKKDAPTQVKQQVAANTGTDLDDGVMHQDAGKAKTDAKTTQTPAQAAQHAGAGAKAGAENAAQGGERAQQAQTQAQSQAQAQSQDLSRRLGGAQRVDVSVTVEKESEALTSRPNLSLAANANATKAAAGAGGRGNDAGQNSAGNNQSQAQAQAQAQMAAQNQTAAAQAAARPAASGFQAQVNAAASGQASAATAGVEGASAATGATATAPGAATQQANTALPQQAANKAHTSPQAQRAVTEQVSVQIAKAAGNGMDKISIRLNPASLGRIDVQLEMTQDGRMTATIMADNKDTLDMLQKDARGLAKALQDAGLNADSNDLNFSMRGDNAPDQGKQSGASGTKTAQSDLGLVEQPLEELLSGASGRNVITKDRVDIQV